MLKFSDLVQRDDHEPFVKQYRTTGSDGVGVVDLNYFEPATVQRKVEEFVLAVHLAPVRVKVDLAGQRRETYSYARGQFDVTPPDSSYASERYDAGTAIAVSLPNSAVREVLSEVAPRFDGDFGRLHETPAHSNLVLQICSQLVREFETSNRLGPLYADALIQALVFELFHSGHCVPAEIRSKVDRLSEAVLQRIDEFIDANAMQVVELRDLAALAAMPLATFSRLFKQTTGHTPYQYVLRRRLGRAQDLILTSRASLAEIAHDCGFSSQSHMNDVFRAKLDITPGRLRSKIE